MTQRWMLFLCTLIAATGCLVGGAEDELDTPELAAGGVNPLATPLRAVKWWNPLLQPEHATSFGLELPYGMSYAKAAQNLCSLGIDTVFIRKGEPKIMIYPGGPCDGLGDTQCRNKINNQIADAIEALKASSCKPRAFVMHRQQLKETGKIDFFVGTELKELLDKLESRGLKGYVQGLAIVETHVETSCELKKRIVEVATKVNAANGNFLRSRTLFVGGQGLGNRFKNINSNDNCPGLRSTLQSLAAQTRAFSFIYKHFDGGAGLQLCSDWGNLKTNPPVATAKQYLLDGCPGLRDLIDGIRTNRQDYPAHANVTFWGDDGDGVTNIAPNVLTALHQIFVTDREAPSFKHAVFDRLFVEKPAASGGACANENHCKHLVEIDANHNPTLNRSSSLNGVPTNVFDTWNNW